MNRIVGGKIVRSATCSSVQYNIRVVSRATCRRTAAVLALVISIIVSASCRGGRFITRYEYDEEIYLGLDGTATVYVNGSMAALVALRGLDLDVNPRARLDRGRIRAMYEAPGIRVVRVSSSRRDGRRFVHLRLETQNVRQLSAAAPFAWSRYELERRGDIYVFSQHVGASANKPVGHVGWTGDEMVAFRFHLPSKIRFHNALADNLRRGNILVWEQSLKDRLSGTPLTMEARMETQSILYTTLWLFGATGIAVAIAVTLAVWWIRKSGREEKA
jgi:hypothetical protein